MYEISMASFDAWPKVHGTKDLNALMWNSPQVRNQIMGVTSGIRLGMANVLSIYKSLSYHSSVLQL